MTPRLVFTLRIGAALLAAVAVVCFVSHYRSDRLVERTVQRVDAGRTLTDEQRFLAYIDFASHEIPAPGLDGLPNALVRSWYRFNPMHPGPADVLRWGSDYRGPCGSRSRVVVAMLQRRHVRSRLLLLLDDQGRSIHTVVEAWIKGRWAVADPTFGIVYKHPDGSYATALELQRDSTLLHAHTSPLPEYPAAYDYLSMSHVNWHKIPVLMPTLERVLVAMLGSDRVKEIAEPTVLWGRPRAVYGLLSTVMALVLVAIAAALTNRHGRVRQRQGLRSS